MEEAGSRCSSTGGSSATGGIGVCVWGFNGSLQALADGVDGMGTGTKGAQRCTAAWTGEGAEQSMEQVVCKCSRGQGREEAGAACSPDVCLEG